MNSNNRWWENYLVRYLAGNIFAVLVIFYLFLNHGNKIASQVCTNDLSKQYNICERFKDNNASFSKEVFSFIFQNTEDTNISGVFTINSKTTTTELNFINFILIGVFGFLYMYIASIPIYVSHIYRFGFAHEGLKKSAKIRDEITAKQNHFCKDGFSPTYIESYQHIREHGNAFGIILMEILFAVYLVSFNFSIYSIVIWICIGFSGWFFGINLEQKMIEKDYFGLWTVVSIMGSLIIFILLIYLSSMQCIL